MNPIFDKPLETKTQNEHQNDVSNEILGQFIDMVFGGSTQKQTTKQTPEQDPNNNEKTSQKNTEPKNKNSVNKKSEKLNTKTTEKTMEKTMEKPTEKSPSTALLDFGNNCIVVNNSKYYIERFVSDTDVVINRLVQLDNVFTIEQFAEKYVDKNKFNYRILSKNLLIYSNKDQKHLLSLVDKNDRIKDYHKFFNCAYLKPDHETKPVVDLLKMDQVIKAQAYFDFELKPRITYLNNEIEYEVFDEVLDFLYNTDKETLRIAFKEFIKCDKEYLSDCALTGVFKKICIIDHGKTKRIYNN